MQIKAQDNIKRVFEESIDTKRRILLNDHVDNIIRIGELAVASITSGGKIMLCGNGGSAADAQHLAAEMLVRLRPNNNREGVPAVVLAQDTSTITACGNDFGYDSLYKRMVQSLGKEGDCLIAISTSGNSKNIILAMQEAQSIGIDVVGFLGAGGGGALELCNEAFVVPSNNTGRIQEAHITAGHALMEYIEDNLLESGYIHLQD